MALATPARDIAPKPIDAFHFALLFWGADWNCHNLPEIGKKIEPLRTRHFLYLLRFTYARYTHMCIAGISVLWVFQSDLWLSIFSYPAILRRLGTARSH